MPVASPPEVRFWRFIAQPVTVDSCWTWTGCTKAKGYGYLKVHGVKVRAHRFAYELLVGPIPAGLVIDHLCRNRACVNPAHLEPVTSRENTLRGQTLAAENFQKSACPQGHALAGENLRVDAAGKRQCKTCRRDWNRQYMQRVRVAA